MARSVSKGGRGNLAVSLRRWVAWVRVRRVQFGEMGRRDNWAAPVLDHVYFSAPSHEVCASQSCAILLDTPSQRSSLCRNLESIIPYRSDPAERCYLRTLCAIFSFFSVHGVTASNCFSASLRFYVFRS